MKKTITPEERESTRVKVSNWREKNRKHHREYMRGYYHRNKERINLRTRCHKYGITIKEYLEMFRKQNGKCAICGVSHLELNQPLYIDHNHDTETARGLLCVNCNFVLGSCKENVVILQKSIDYLKTFE